MNHNYEPPGAGVSKNTEKKGAPLLLAILAGNAGGLIKTNILLQLSLLPLQAIVMALATARAGTNWLAIPAAAFVCSIPIGPSLAAAGRCICMMIMGQPCYVWHEFSKAWKHSFFQSAFAGIVAAMATAAYTLFFIMLMYGAVRTGSAVFVCILVSAATLFSIIPSYFLQAAFVDLKPRAILKNSLLMAAAFLPRFAACGITLLISFMAILAFLPVSTIALPLFGYSIPMLLASMFVWPKINDLFHIKKSL